MCLTYQPGFKKKKTAEGVSIDGDVAVVSSVFLQPEEGMVDFVPSRQEVFVRFRLFPLSAYDEDGNIGGEAGQASREPRNTLRDADDVTTVLILPSLEVVDAHDRVDLGDEHLLNFGYSLHMWEHVSRVHVVVGGEGFGVLLVAVAAFAPVCLRKSKVQKVKRAPHHGLVSTFYNPSRSEFKSLGAFFVFVEGMFPLFCFCFPYVFYPPRETNISKPDREE